MSYEAGKINKVLTTIMVAVVDEVFIYEDETQGYTKPFQTSKDISRTVLALGGYAFQAFMPRYAKFFDIVAMSETPLLAKSVITALMHQARTGLQPREEVVQKVGQEVSMKGTPLSQSTKPEFG
jgi:hypothetical protein